MLRWLFFIVVALNIALFAWFEREQYTRSQMADRPQGFDEEVAKLVLLSEVKQQLRERSANNQSLPEDLPSSPGSIDRSICIEIRNFPSQEAMLAWQAKLPANVAVMTSDWIPADEYWVYIEAPSSLQERQQQLDELRALGLEVSIVQRGENRGSLSLGRYSDRELAVALYEGVLAQGYPGRMLAVGTNADDLALWISLTEQLSADLSWLDNLLSGTEFLKSEKKVCEGVASQEGHE